MKNVFLFSIGMLLALSAYSQMEGVAFKTKKLKNPQAHIDYSESLNCLFNSFNCGGTADTSYQVILGAGVWRIEETVFIGYYDQLVLDHGAIVKRTDCVCGPDDHVDPIFHLRSRYASIKGVNKNLIKSDCECNDYVMIKVGHEDVETNGNIHYCSVKNVEIHGPITDDESNNTTGIYYYNNQHEPENDTFSTKTSYFHLVDDVQFSFLFNGIKIYNSNACTFNNLLFNRVGIGGGNAFLFEGGIEHKISNVHHHSSPNSSSLTFKGREHSEYFAAYAISNYVVETHKTKIHGEHGGGCIDVREIDTFGIYNSTINLICVDSILLRGVNGEITDVKSYFNASNTSRSILHNHTLSHQYVPKQ